MRMQNAPFISAVAALIAAFLLMLLTGLGVLEALVLAALVAVVAYLITSWQTRRTLR